MDWCNSPVSQEKDILEVNRKSSIYHVGSVKVEMFCTNSSKIITFKDFDDVSDNFIYFLFI